MNLTDHISVSNFLRGPHRKGDGKGCVWGKMAKKKKKACKCKHWRRYEIISYCNILLTVGNAETGIWGGRGGCFSGEV